MLYLLLSRVTQENKGKGKGKGKENTTERKGKGRGFILHGEMNNLHKEACRISLPIGVS